MSTSKLHEQIAAATAYEQLFVPAIFEQWTPWVLDTAGIKPGHRVLDVACGTGVLAREAAVRTGESGHVAGLDITPGMLEVAGQLAPAIEWREGNATDLPFADASFDAVVSQFGFMFFPDREQSLREMLRVLVPGGRLAVAVWDSLDAMPAYADEVALLERMAGTAAADALRVPFVLGDKDGLAALAEQAGVGSVGVQTRKGTARFPSIRTLVEADLRGWLPVMGVILTEDLIQDILTEAEEVMKPYADAQGQAVFEVSAHIISGTAS